MYSSSRLSFLALCVATVACNNYSPYGTGACLSAGDQSCIDWSQGQDVQLVQLPHNEEGDGLVAYTRDGDMIYDPNALAYIAYSKANSGVQHVSIADDPDVSMGPQMLPQGTKLSQDRWFTVTQDISHNQRVYGCVQGRIVDFKMNTRITLKGQLQPLLDIHFVYYRDEAGRRCWGIYDSGTGSSGPGVCYCEDENNPAPPEAKIQAMRQETRNQIPSDTPTALKYAVVILLVGGAINGMTGGFAY